MFTLSRKWPDLTFERVYSGLAMRMMIDLGMHRRPRSNEYSLQEELKKRLFWAGYYLEREVAVALGISSFTSAYKNSDNIRSTTSNFRSRY